MPPIRAVLLPSGVATIAVAFIIDDTVLAVVVVFVVVAVGGGTVEDGIVLLNVVDDANSDDDCGVGAAVTKHAPVSHVQLAGTSVAQFC